MHRGYLSPEGVCRSSAAFTQAVLFRKHVFQVSLDANELNTTQKRRSRQNAVTFGEYGKSNTRTETQRGWTNTVGFGTCWVGLRSNQLVKHVFWTKPLVWVLRRFDKLLLAGDILYAYLRQLSLQYAHISTNNTTFRKNGLLNFMVTSDEN